MDNQQIMNFGQFIAAHEDGALNDDLTTELHDMITELNNVMIEQGGCPAGEITLKIKFKYDSGMIEVKANVATKLPRLDRVKASYWSTDKNLLTRQNPKQPDMFRDVNQAREVRTV